MSGYKNSLSNYNSRMVEIEVTGLCRQEIIRTSNYKVKVPYSRMSQKIQEITRMGGKIKGVRMISSSIAVSQPSSEPVSSVPVSSETEGSETEGSSSSESALADMTEVKPVRSKSKSVEAKKSTTKRTRAKKMKRKPNSEK